MMARIRIRPKCACGTLLRGIEAGDQSTEAVDRTCPKCRARYRCIVRPGRKINTKAGAGIAHVVELVCTRASRPPKGAKTITRSRLHRLSVCNSDKLPTYVSIGGKRRMWVGIGWIECRDEAPEPGDPIMVEDDGSTAEAP